MQNWRATFIPCLIWIGVVTAALIAGLAKGLSLQDLALPAVILAIPGIFGVCLSPIIEREWAQIGLILAWLALAICVCLFAGYYPFAVLFLAAPVIASLFKREKIVESLILATVFAALIYFAFVKGAIPESPLNDVQKLWMSQAGIMGLISLVISTLFSIAQERVETAVPSSAGISTDAIEVRGDNRFVLDSDVIETLNGSVMRFSKSGALMAANNEARSKFHFNALGMTTLNSVMSGSHSVQETFSNAVKKSLKSDQPETIRIALPNPFDAQSINSFDATLLPQSDGGVLVHAIDRTAEETQIEALRQQAVILEGRPDEKTLFFAGVSHELRTPLNAIIGFSDMMRSRLFGPLPSKYAEYADLIHDSGQHMLDLIGDVLDLSKVEAGKYSLQYDTFDASDVVRSSVKMLRPAADAAEVKFEVSIDSDDSLLVEADRKALRQILLNLLSNAVKFSYKGGQVLVKAQHKNEYLLLVVEDQGEGISADELERIGTPFTQSQSGLNSNERGSGLGLSLVKSLTELHQGQFSIQSELEQGTRVTVALPWSRPITELK
ncbi:signal transduction histidine kinase [Litorimonas taeanensis]|uniref:histidine kinase n=1 Tax=Litorimonas taeanensis TaxID=568099 RepID=A0A420WFH0_9PROT|nr:ATP-binding protein [Litorimonas taeanensis]RKQ69748.1 signal transduction histidine kinase [Litorimonas taeanensis]